VSTLVGLLRYGGIQGIMTAGPHLLRLVHSSLEDERILAACRREVFSVKAK
jgi:hypothetical protein